jgi:hypothetical protein
MDVEELRIGNLVNHEQTTHVIKSIGGDRVSSVWIRGTYNDIYNSSIKHIKPIEITEEWLVRFGFEKETIRVAKIKTYRLNGLSVWFNSDKIISVYIGEQRVDDGCKIKYVHSLQNLYYALTGEELTITQSK